MYLLLWGTTLTLCSQLVRPVVNFLLQLTCTITEYEINLRTEIRELRKELSRISMQDQFAVYAKTERKINKLSEKLGGVTQARSVQFSKASWAYTITLHSILGLVVMATMWSFSSSPVMTLPPAWTWPLTPIISIPTGVPGGVGLPLWMGLSSAFLRSLPKISLWPVRGEYSQLPLD